MTPNEEFILEIKEILRYAIKHKDWTDVCEVVEMINEQLDIEEKIDYVSPRDREDEETENEEGY
jgi:hypothetical protein